MKLFDLDWGAFLRVLPAWERLDVASRRRLLDTLKPSGAVAAQALGEQLDALLSSGLVETTGTRAAVAAEMRPFVVALRAMDRHRELLADPVLPKLVRYLEEHFTNVETEALQQGIRGYGYGWVDRHQVARQVASVDWLEQFLELGKKAEIKQWEDAHRGRTRPPLLGAGTVFETTQRLVRTLLPHRHGLRFAELSAALGGIPDTGLGSALHAALHYLLAVSVLDPETLEPRLGVWPPAARRLLREPAPPPQPVEPAESFHAASLMEDMTSVLVAAAGEPLRLRGNDYEIFARQQQAIAERLLVLPGWLQEALGIDTEQRISWAASLLRVLKMARVAGTAGTDLRLEATRKGGQWLALSDRDRLATLLDALRASKARNPSGWYSADEPFPFFPGHVPIRLPDKVFDLRVSLADALLSEQSARFVRLENFLEYHSQERNPFLAPAVRAQLRGTYRTDVLHRMKREDWEDLWATQLRGFLGSRLIVLGGARVGRTTRGEICFAITEIGWYLFDGADDFDYGHDAQAEVVVQPNFEIVFLAPAPKVEAQLARFAERKGAGPGMIFQLTRASVLAAAEAGLTAEQVLETLRQASAHDLPGNIERQVRDWVATVRRVTVHSTVLIRCPDKETAARVRAAGGANLRPLTDTVLEMVDGTSKARQALLRKLRKDGVFLKL
jgi:hypothetical protein